MKTFQRNETVICSILVKDEDDVLTDPATSMNIVINNPAGTAVVTSTGMTKDAVGTYHYDYQPAADAPLGKYKTIYTATDGSRVTIHTDTFLLENKNGS